MRNNGGRKTGRLRGTARFGATARGTVARGAAAALLAGVMLTGTGGFAAAQEQAAPTTAAPVAATTQFILTMLPNAWQTRLDLKPVLEVQSDGTAVKRPDGGAQEIKGMVPAAALATAATEIRALAAADLGTPSVTDQGAVILDYMPTPPDQDVHLIVYAPAVTDGLTAEQTAARVRVTTVFDNLLAAFVAG